MYYNYEATWWAGDGRGADETKSCELVRVDLVQSQSDWSTDGR